MMLCGVAARSLPSVQCSVLFVRRMNAIEFNDSRDGSLQYKSIDNRRLYCLKVHQAHVHQLTTLTCCSLRLRDNSMCPARTGGIYQDARILKWMSGMHDWVSNCIDCDEIARARKMKKMRNLYGRWTRRRSLEGI